MITDLSLSRLWSWSHLRDWSWPSQRTSLDPCWILFSLPTEKTGLWMTLSIWDCITSCNTSINLGITQGSYLWTSAWPSLPSCLTFSQTTYTTLCAHLHLSVDHQLPDRQAAASEAGQTHIQNSHHQHWRPSGLRSLPTALLPLHQWLHFKGPLFQAPEVWGWHYSHWPHQEVEQLLSGAFLTTWS